MLLTKPSVFVAYGFDGEYLMSSMYEKNCDPYTTKKLSIDEQTRDLFNEILSLEQDNSSIPGFCFFISNLQTVRKVETYRFHTCKSFENEYPTLTKKRVCLDKDYIDITQGFFNYLSGCFDLNKEKLFRLFNHESGFTLTIRSPTGPRCYGQLSALAIKDMGYNVISRKKKDNIYQFPRARFRSIYNTAFKKCPILKDIKKINLETDGSNNISCGLTQKPETCFLYSMLYVKKLFEESKDVFRDLIQKEGYFEWVQVPSDETEVLSDEAEEIFWNLTYLAYNGGTREIRRLISQFNKYNSFVRKGEDKNNINLVTFLNRLLSFIKMKFLPYKERDSIKRRWFNTWRKRNEIGNYLKKIYTSIPDNFSLPNINLGLTSIYSSIHSSIHSTIIERFESEFPDVSDVYEIIEWFESALESAFSNVDMPINACFHPNASIPPQN